MPDRRGEIPKLDDLAKKPQPHPQREKKPGEMVPPGAPMDVVEVAKRKLMDRVSALAMCLFVAAVLILLLPILITAAGEILAHDPQRSKMFAEELAQYVKWGKDLVVSVVYPLCLFVLGRSLGKGDRG